MDHGLRIRAAANPSLWIPPGNLRSLGQAGGGHLGLQPGFQQLNNSHSRRILHKHRSRNLHTFICRSLPDRPSNYGEKRIEPIWAPRDFPGECVKPQVGVSRVLQERLCEGPMTVSAGITIQDGKLLVYGEPLLKNVPSNVVFTSDSTLHGGFLGASFSDSKSHHVTSLGVLEDVRFLCCFRFKLWWMTQRMGSCGREVPYETQFMLLEGPSDNYTVLLPVIDGAFRACLQGNVENELQLCVESGDPATTTNNLMNPVYVNVGSDPFEVISEAVRAMEAHLQTFVHREKKKMPGILDYFGWCTWDAFYTDVSAEGVTQGLSSLAGGGTPARFLIIDDGWQSIAADNTSKGDATAVTQGTQYASRLTHIKENHKFQKDGVAGSWPEDQSLGLRHTVLEAKTNFNLKYVYVWHALAGYWGGVQPGGLNTKVYDSNLVYPIHSPGVLDNQPDMSVDSLTVNGLGLVDPKKFYAFYDGLHSYLAAAGVDGVKVDAQNIFETLGAGLGGRVKLVQQVHEALEASIAQNFPENGCISCMSHSTDNIYYSKQTAVVRASDDFWPRDPASHTIHIASVAYNTLFLAEFMQPDWDMFHSLHPAAEYHAAARAVGGCAIYVSDKPGHHDFDLLKKLVLPDGTVLRALLPGRPTRDCLFSDPARDGKSLLKIWNMNKYGGVIGIFNCQGAGWCKSDKKYTIHDLNPDAISGSVRAADIERLADAAPDDWDGDCVVLSHRSCELIRIPRHAALPITLQKLEYELFTVAPVKNLDMELSFAPLGLIKMFNAGGALRGSINYDTEGKTVSMQVLGCGLFGVYASQRPQACVINHSTDIPFSYDQSSGLVSLSLPLVTKEGHLWTVTMRF
ncbi:hypothetical protein M758_3G184100 [Ceratodon purpureus]|nr:hypothetical protein M758_3G184100 [Ceratodon purpureus]KAG0623572.1 hypothetical protein M758_3G184100 [Ceratodon purpureus]